MLIAHTSIINVFVHSVIDDLWLFLLRHIFYLSINFYDLLLLLVYLAHTFNFEDIRGVTFFPYPLLPVSYNKYVRYMYITANESKTCKECEKNDISKEE